jgi:uncharacterized repeat protein (TIGR01451 family)
MNVGMFAMLPLVAGGPTGSVPAPPAGPPPAAMTAPRPVAVPFPQPGMGLPVPAPVLAAKVLAPQGVRVTAFPGTRLARMAETPAVFGFRPGYVYRLELSNLPGEPGRKLYPEVEVYGSLVPRPGMKYMDWPAPLLFTALDIEHALNGAVITKVVYLEDPEKAFPGVTGPDNPVEFPAVTEREAIKTAMASGRLVAIVRLGGKTPPVELLQATAIDGTVLLPGDRYLKSPILPPMLPWYACPLYDPILGPKGPKEECFLDGGDRENPLGIGPFGRLGGLDPTDVGVEYTIAGRRRVTTSCNVVCICSPRFMIQRVEQAPGGLTLPFAPSDLIATKAPGRFQERVPTMAFVGRENPTELEGKVKLSAYIGKVGTSFFIGSSRPSVIAQIEGVKITAALVEPEELTNTSCPLTVTKDVTPSGPVKSGDVVTITIRYKNTGNRPVSDVVVSDSLSGRLEYLPGSQETDRAANFTTAANEAGSTVVRWELPGTLLVGQGGTVRFKARVR